MNCLTTVVGAMFFGAREANPVLAGLVSSNLSGFVVVKFAVTVTVSLIFVLAQKTLMRTSDQSTNAYKIGLRILKMAYFTIILFLALVVANNILVLMHLIVETQRIFHKPLLRSPLKQSLRNTKCDPHCQGNLSCSHV
ncbi:MAG: DUF5658 family protein [Candidatus Bathyarchaeia archaeon]